MMPYYTFSLAWPDRSLHPNGRPHFMAKARAVRNARNEACGAARAAKVKRSEKAHIHFTFHPNLKGPMPDDDGCTASVKAHIDGISDALGMNDLHITKSYHVSPERRKGGAVVVNVSTDEAAEIPLKGQVS